MTDQRQKFIQAMRDQGIGPYSDDDIIADDKRRRYRLESDKARELNGSYVLRIDDDGFAVGFARSWKAGSEPLSWNVRSSRKATEEEKAAWKQKLADDRARREAEEAELRRTAAEQSVRMWSEAMEDGTHPYVERKGLSGLHGARVWLDTKRGETALLVPCVRADGQMVGMQKIYADGEKLFVYGGEKQGCWFTITGDPDRVAICEGFATGAAVHEATGATVVVAFDAGNLKAVASEVLRVYGVGRVVFAADNDLDEGVTDGQVA